MRLTNIQNRFDDVVRKRAVDDKPFLPSRFFELNDQKSTQSLAQIYEDEYTANANSTGVDDRDGRLKKEHEELEKLWDNISYKLDSLSNAHFTPKQASGPRPHLSCHRRANPTYYHSQKRPYPRFQIWLLQL